MEEPEHWAFTDGSELLELDEEEREEYAVFADRMADLEELSAQGVEGDSSPS